MTASPQASGAITLRSQSQPSPSITLVTEAYNLAEGQSEASFLRAVGVVDAIARRNANVQIVVVDLTPDNIAAPVLARHAPHIQSVHLAGQTYDGQKNTVCRQAQTEFVVFLDGDCKPQQDDWLAQLLSPFADVTIPAVSGLTLYEDFSITGKAMTILDFGFLFDSQGGALGCYVSNNIAFRREAMLNCPIPDIGLLRCHCYKHAQLLQRAGTPIRFQPQALVHHELPDVKKERHRRGYDYVAGPWADPTLPETAWLEPTEAFVTRILKQNLDLALARLRVAPPALKITADQVTPIAAEIERLIALDAPGVWEALRLGESNGLNQKARDSHFASLPKPPLTKKRWFRLF